MKYKTPLKRKQKKLLKPTQLIYLIPYFKINVLDPIKVLTLYALLKEKVLASNWDNNIKRASLILKAETRVLKKSFDTILELQLVLLSLRFRILFCLVILNTNPFHN